MAYGISFDEINTLTEGQQADEYLRRKAENYTKDSKEYKNKYGSRDFDTYHSGKRSQNYDKNDNLIYPYSPTADNNPRFDTARDIENHRERYGKIMPSRKSQSEKDLDKAKEKELKEREYAAKFGGETAEDGRPTVRAQAAMDAARRHYRRHLKNESSIFESVEII